MKKIGMMFLAGAILVTPSFAAFSDLDSSHWAYDAISKMEETEILSGYSDGSFKPSNNITLAEFATIFTKIFEIPGNFGTDYFIDVPSSHWAKGYIEAIREYINPFYDSVGEYLGVTNYSYLKSLPGDIEMTREAFIYSVSKIYGYNEELYVEGEEKLLFADYEDILFPKEVVLAYKNNVISGEVVDGKVYINPNRCITRAEAAAIFRNLLKYDDKRVTNKNEESQLSATFSDLVKKLKSEGILASKEFIYDTQNVLKNDKFLLSDSQVLSFDELLSMVLEDFNYEVLEKGFDSFNRGYIKVKLKCYDVFDKLTLLESEEADIEVIIDEIKEEIKKRKIKVADFEKTFYFAKKDGEWKLMLK